MKPNFDQSCLERLYQDGKAALDAHYAALRACALVTVPEEFRHEIPDRPENFVNTFTAETYQAGIGILWGVPPYEGIAAFFEFDKESGAWHFSKYTVRQMAAMQTPMGVVTMPVQEKHFQCFANAVVFARHIGQESLDAAQQGLSAENQLLPSGKPVVN